MTTRPLPTICNVCHGAGRVYGRISSTNPRHVNKKCEYCQPGQLVIGATVRVFSEDTSPCAPRQGVTGRVSQIEVGGGVLVDLDGDEPDAPWRCALGEIEVVG